jgi:hypothetical protein
MASTGLVSLCAALVVFLLVPSAHPTVVGETSPRPERGGQASWRWILKPVIAAAAVLLIAGCAGLAIRMEDARRGVVLVQDAPLRVAPLEKSPAPSTLRVGDVVQIQNRRPPFFYITAQDGKQGWVTDRELAPVIPGS